MRIDKYLKNSRLIKRRTIAKDACDQKRIMINKKAIKAGANVSVGDEVSIEFGNKILTIKVLSLLEHLKKEEATSMYEIISEIEKPKD